MKRMSKEEYYLNITEAVAKRGTCLRRLYGSVIVKDDHIVSSGYVGAPRGRKNCCDIGSCIRNDNNIPRGTHYELCLSGDTNLRCATGLKTIKEYVESGKANVLPVVSLGNDNNVSIECVTNATHTGNRRVVEVTFGDNTRFRCTPNHPIMLTDNSYKEASLLTPHDAVMGYIYKRRNDVFVNFSDQYKLISKRIARVRELSYEKVYDITVPTTENFAIEIGENTGIFVHNCRSVHSEMNAIIQASPDELKDSTLYLVGIECETGDYVKDANCCAMCKRAVINAGIKQVIVRTEPNCYKTILVKDWIDNDDSLNLTFGY